MRVGVCVERLRRVCAGMRLDMRADMCMVMRVHLGRSERVAGRACREFLVIHRRHFPALALFLLRVEKGGVL